MGTAPSNAPLCCANRWHSTPTLHLCITWHLCATLHYCGGHCTASVLWTPRVSGNSPAAFHLCAVTTRCTFASRCTSVPLLYCTHWICAYSGPSLSPCTTAAALLPTVGSRPVSVFPPRCRLVALPGFLLAAPAEQHLCLERAHCMLICPSLHTAQRVCTHRNLGHFVELWHWPGFFWVAPLHSTQHCISALHTIAAPSPYPVLYLLIVGLCTLYWVSGPRALALNSLFHMAPSLYSMFVPLSTPALASALALLLGTVLSLCSGLDFLLHHTICFSSLCLCAVLQAYTGHFISMRIHGAPAIPGPVLVSGAGEELGRFELSTWAFPPPLQL